MFKNNIVRIKRIADICFGLVMVFAVGIMIKNYIDQTRLPEGVCPVANNYVYMVIAIVFLIIAFTATTIIDYLYKKYKKDEGENSELKG